MDLDAQQRVVVGLAPEASVVVLGAPGTGKTAAIIERVCSLLGERDVPAALAADELLVLTPSRSAATMLRDHIGVQLGIATPGPLARSLGSLAYQIVRATRAAAGRPAPLLLTGADQDRIIADLLEGDIADDRRDRWPFDDLLTLRAAEFRGELRALLDQAIELGVQPQEFAGLGNPVWAGAGDFLREYQAILAELRADYVSAPGLLAEATDALRTGTALGELDALRVILIDDAQELTRGGTEFLQALLESGRAIVAFGDPDVSAGAFRGATPAGFNMLVSLLGGPIVFEVHHRQQRPGLVTALREVTSAIGVAGRGEHRRPPEKTGDVSVRALVAESASGEFEGIAQQLRSWHLTDGIAWNDLAVIAHDARDVALIESELASREVPARAVGVQRPLGQVREVRDLLEFVQLALAPLEARTVEQVRAVLEGSYCGLDSVAMRRLRARLRQFEWSVGGDRSADELMLEAASVPGAIATIDAAEARAVVHVAQLVSELSAAAQTGETVHELLWRVWESARLPDGRQLSRAWIKAAQAHGSEASRGLDSVVQLFDAAKRALERNPGEPPATFIAEMLDSEVPEDALVGRRAASQVAVLTPAAAAGTEFARVVIARLQEGVWPNTRLRGSLLGSADFVDVVDAYRSGHSFQHRPVLDRQRQVIHDELRLFARAISRAREAVVLTAVHDEDAVPSAFAEYAQERVPVASALGESARWDAGFPLTLRGAVAIYRRRLTENADAAVRVHAAGQLRALAAAGVPGADPAEWYGVRGPSTTEPLHDIDAGRLRVSPSRLSKFSACQLDWAISALGGDKPRISSGIGTLLHAATEAFPTGEFSGMSELFERRWSELKFDSAWLGEREKREAIVLLQRLSVYLQTVGARGGVVVANEQGFAVPIVEPSSGEQLAQLVGKVDRVEFYPEKAPERLEQAAGTAIIVDIKSGKTAPATAAGVADDKQLLAYQFAYREGAVEVDGEQLAPLGGARLVSLRHTNKSEPHYRLPTQPPIDSERAEAFRAELVFTARAMAANHFEADAEGHCQAEGGFHLCGPHTIKAVSSA